MKTLMFGFIPYTMLLKQDLLEILSKISNDKFEGFGTYFQVFKLTFVVKRLKVKL